MSLLKISALTVSGITLWLAPPFIFSRKIPLHNFMQGVALVSGFACAFEARRCALKAAKTEEFEAMKEAAVTADVVDEISTSIYISEQQRRKEAEAILAASWRKWKPNGKRWKLYIPTTYSQKFPLPRTKMILRK
jgi:hypothetical protein